MSRALSPLGWWLLTPFAIVLILGFVVYRYTPPFIRWLLCLLVFLLLTDAERGEPITMEEA